MQEKSVPIALVTGAAGFIGSRLCEGLLENGYAVRGLDALTSYYDPERKRANLTAARRHDAFTLVEGDLRHLPLGDLLDGVDVVFHQAGQPGVRASWDVGFADYVEHNVLATQRLLEAVRQSCPHARVVFASSSSVYGEGGRFPVEETDTLRPHSPYGVTKLASEQLCHVYADNFGLSTVVLRYFTVYGARQRPDMALYRLIAAALGGDPFPLFGDGGQIRDFTHVSDVVEANLAAARADVPSGIVCNISGGSSATLAELIDLVSTAAGVPVPVVRCPAQAGDVRRTGGSSQSAARLLGWTARTTLADGLREQVKWQRQAVADGRLSPLSGRG